ncbi:hypothetical protein RIF29_38620 [Crotalaria pallida]|uniref:Uncharacterized protein n=1 Tax=Crotalaria pallida TaxID=3830 RepID=A0AAN9DZN6_CROPI
MCIRWRTRQIDAAFKSNKRYAYGPRTPSDVYRLTTQGIKLQWVDESSWWGELDLEICKKDLQEDFMGGAEIIKSDPVV